MGIPAGATTCRSSRRLPACHRLRLPSQPDTPSAGAGIARAAVRDVLDNPRYRQRAKELRLEIEGLQGPEQAVNFLEQLAAGHELTLSHR